MGKPWWSVLLVVWFSTAMAATEAVTVRVGGYAFPPYVDVDSQHQPFGLTLDLLALLNESQNQFRFEFVLTSPNRRFQDFAAGRFDAIVFEDSRWGWANQMMEASPAFLRDGDRFVSGRKPERNQRYFAELGNKRIFAVRGYHYAFLDFQAEPGNSPLRVELLDPTSASLDRGLQQIASDHADLMITTDSYLQYAFLQQPALRDRVLLAEKYDTEYALGALVRKQQRFTAAHFDQLIHQLHDSGQLQALAARYGIADKLLLTKP